MLDSSKLKEFADDNFNLDENGRKFFEQVENTVGKGEIACFEQFSFSHLVFKTYTVTRKIQDLFGKQENASYKHFFS